MTTPSFTQLNNVEYNGFPKLLNDKIRDTDRNKLYLKVLLLNVFANYHTATDA